MYRILFIYQLQLVRSYGSTVNNAWNGPWSLKWAKFVVLTSTAYTYGSIMLLFRDFPGS